ncbi:MAG: 2-amino-4-hydroxy-6-hydroxymethyldihydropteridine diphosphokinase [Synergistaceae bacterium]|nr:2-amino-4-hydroxy-6-hydroxymethyldihydropteridine diphosphokinase [Synergistaceae bacterium]
MKIYFALGSNLGNRLQNLREAVRRLESLGHVSASSDVFSTAPWGGVAQPDYLNACVRIDSPSDYEPHEILKAVKNFEREIGRVESVRWGARKIDIDILLMDDVIFHSQDLDIPHARIPERLFVLVPLSQIVPDGWRHPENGLTVHEMIAGVDGESLPLRVTEL